MKKKPVSRSANRVSPSEEECFRAGQRVPAGDYRQVDTAREVHLDTEDVLPASLDGHVALYVRRPLIWADIVSHDGDDDFDISLDYSFD